jgi:AraC-like DNA-binding protein
MRHTACYETRHGRDDTLALHRHADAYAALVLDGSHVEVSVDGPRECTPGTLVLHPRFHAHGNRFGRSGARVVNLALPMNAYDGSRALRVHDLRETRRCFEHGDPVALQALLAEATSAPERDDDDSWRAAFLAALRDDDAPIAAIARRIGVSAAYASRALLRSHGMGPQALRRELRFRRALMLLGSGDRLVDVAQQAGFADQSHMTRTMRAHSGLTPSQLRGQVKCVQDRVAFTMA